MEVNMNAMKRRAIIGLGSGIALPLIVAAAPIAAAAATPCYPRDAIQAHLAERYSERPVGIGVAAGQLVELLVRPDGTSWTSAARLAAIPAGESPANRGVQSLL
jgi:hypothetical protein